MKTPKTTNVIEMSNHTFSMILCYVMSFLTKRKMSHFIGCHPLVSFYKNNFRFENKTLLRHQEKTRKI